MSYLCQKCKKNWGHRLHFRDKTCGRLPVRRSQIVQSAIYGSDTVVRRERTRPFFLMNGQKFLKHNLSSVFHVVFSFKAQKQLTISICQDSFKFYRGILRWVLFILNSVICKSSKCDNFTFHANVCSFRYFCFPCQCMQQDTFVSLKIYERCVFFFLLTAGNKWNM